MKEGWERKKLGELCIIELGRTPSRASAAFWDDKRETSNVWLSIADLLKAEDNVVVDSKEYVSDKGAEICKPVLKGTLLVSFKLTLGRLAFAGRDLFTNEAIAALTVLNERELSKEFLFYFLNFFDWVGAAKNDVKLKGMTLNKAKLKEMDVHFPKSLPEQQRIVGILDEAFAGIATAKATAEKNLQNARALFESHLNGVFSQQGDGWVETTLADVCGFQNGFAFKSRTFKTSGFPVLRISNIQDGRIDRDNRLVFFDPKDYRENLDRYRIVEDDLVIAMSGATTGKLAFNTESTVLYLNQRVGKFEPRKNLNKRFLYHFLSTKVKENLRISAGAAQPNLSTEQIKSLMLPLPPLPEQQRIVGILDDLSEETRRLEALYEQKLTALEALKNSLLHQAFAGAL